MLHEHLITFSNCDEDKTYTRGKILHNKMKRDFPGKSIRISKIFDMDFTYALI